MDMFQKIKKLYYLLICEHALFFVELLYGDIWTLRQKILSEKKHSGFRKKIYMSYFAHYGSWIGLGAQFDSIPIFPHKYYGIFISNSARIGKNVVIFHQVTIGSVSTKGSKNNGAPVIEDDVYIGCGAKIIGNIRIGHHARIGANAIVSKDVPPNSVVITKGTECIVKDELLDNSFSPNHWEPR
jgi:serine acetyltransferase